MSGNTNREVIKSCKIKLRKILDPYSGDLLDLLHAEKIITDSQFKTLKEKKLSELVRAMLDDLYDLGEEVCTSFLRQVLSPYCTENINLLKQIKTEVAPVYQAMTEGDTSDGTSKLETVKPSTIEFYNSTKGKDDVYQVMPRGPERQRQALIINNRNFTGRLSMREGSEKDVASLAYLFKRLDYTPIVHKDKSAEEIENLVKTFAQMDEHMQSDSTFVVIMSHGCINGIFGKDENDLLSTDKVYTALNNVNCKGLSNKPKIIIVQACRNITRDALEPVQELGVDPPSFDGSVHRESDMTCLYSTLPEEVSYRNRKSGSHLIQTLVKVMMEYACSQHVQDLLTRVKQECSEMKTAQMPVDERNSLRRKFYLFPGC